MSSKQGRHTRLGSNQSIVSSLSYASMFGANISSYEAKGPTCICLDGHIWIWVFQVKSLSNSSLIFSAAYNHSTD